MSTRSRANLEKSHRLYFRRLTSKKYRVKEAGDWLKHIHRVTKKCRDQRVKG